MDCILATVDYTQQIELTGVETKEIDLGPPAFLYRKFRHTGNETWEILPRLIAEWTIATIPEREPGVARARLCLSIPKDVDRETKKRMQMAFMLWLVGALKRIKGERG